MPETGVGIQEQPPRQIQEIRTVTEVPFPEDPQTRFETIFAAIGNSEAKCLTLLIMSNSPQTANELNTNFLRVSNRAWKMDQKSQASYARQSLIPIGLVAEADTLYFGSSEYITGFRTTDAGVKFGKPIAAFLLEKSSELPYSLNAIFGPTSSPREKRPVINRVNILEYLAKKGNKFCTMTEIATELGLTRQSIRGHLEMFAKLGIVNYSSFNSEEGRGQIKYTAIKSASDKNIKPIGTDIKLSRIVSEIALDLGLVDINIVFEEIKRKYPDQDISRNRINSILSGLSRQGLLERTFGPSKVGLGQIRSKVKITEEGLKIIEEIIDPIMKVLSSPNQEELREWNKINWHSYAEGTIRRYKESSGHANLRPIQEWASDALSLIIDNPGIRPVEMRRKLNRGTNDILAVLIKQGLVRKEKIGKATRYYPKPPTV
jgi:DNA-binding MarR family transcriptional regulator